MVNKIEATVKFYFCLKNCEQFIITLHGLEVTESEMFKIVILSLNTWYSHFYAVRWWLHNTKPLISSYKTYQIHKYNQWILWKKNNYWEKSTIIFAIIHFDECIIHQIKQMTPTMAF